MHYLYPRHRETEPAEVEVEDKGCPYLRRAPGVPPIDRIDPPKE
jgi:hypothetical protein